MTQKYLRITIPVQPAVTQDCQDIAERHGFTRVIAQERVTLTTTGTSVTTLRYCAQALINGIFSQHPITNVTITEGEV